jgi:hypothetical protein
MRTPVGHQKRIFYTPKVKKKQRYIYRIYPTKFPSSIQKYKKVIETPNKPIEIKKLSNKSMFSISKVKRRHKFVWRLPDEVCRLNPKS